METRTKTCGPIPGGSILTHTPMGVSFLAEQALLKLVRAQAKGPPSFFGSAYFDIPKRVLDAIFAPPQESAK